MSRTPLKILVTHHLLQERRSQVMAGAPKTEASLTNYAKVLAVARRAGFHLAFSTGGELNEVLADVPTRGSSRPSLRQIVAPSLQKTLSYNEIIATREQGSDAWRIEARPIKLSDPPDSAPTLIVLNTPAQAVPAAPVRPDAEAAVRKELEQRVRTALRQLAEEVAYGQPDVPSTPLATLRDAVDEVIFRDFTIGNIGLALKGTSGFSKVELVSDFITDEDWNDGRFLYPFEYPSSPAAWALILGKIIACSRQFTTKNMLDDDDIEWLNNTGRRARVLDLLEQQVTLAAKLPVDATTKAGKVQRATRLRDDFGQNILTLQNTADNPAQTLNGKIEEVIYVPVPHRTTAGNVQDLPEIGTLVIEVGLLKDANANAQTILTSERRDMLTTISDAMYAILATANELRRPPGSWRRTP
ncbi:MAG TPA: hypothetical protein VFU88_12755 [Ktedonobacterales bacterium]|nr:hypothetical protein [Ktedonobacterales bacterium]